MKIYWDYSSTPELKPLSKEERKDIMRHCHSKVLKDRRFWYGVLIFFMFYLASSIAGKYVWKDLGYSEIFYYIIHAGGILIGLFIWGILRIEILRPYFRDYIENKRLLEKSNPYRFS